MEELQQPVTVAQRIIIKQERMSSKAAFKAVSSHFDHVFSTAAAAQQVPVLTHDTADTLPPGGLVRFRGMVVDMFNPEFFLGAYKTTPGAENWLPAALFTDTPPADVDTAAETVIMERRPLLLIPVPSEQHWASAAWAGQPVEPQTPRACDRTKHSRRRDQPQGSAAGAGRAGTADTLMDTGTTDDATAAAGASACKAAKLDNHAGCEASGAAAELKQGRDQNDGTAQRVGTAAAAAVEADEHEQQQPAYAPGDCIVQVYGDCDHLKLHDVVEVLGVMSVLPGLAALHLDQQQHNQNQGDQDAAMLDADEFWQERVAALPPTSEVMRLHAVSINKVSPNPLKVQAAPPADASTSSAAAAPAWAPAASDLRERVVSLLAAPLAGDELAAEYLLLTCLSSVVGRDADGAVGVIPLNLSHCPAAKSTGQDSSTENPGTVVLPGLTAALSMLLPHVAPLPLSLSALNKQRWYPQQHSATGRLFRGRLQQPEGALLLLDETRLSAGQLGENGVKNLQALRQVLAQQQLPCGCQVYSHNLLVDQPAVLCSTEGRSLLRDCCTMLQVPLQPQVHKPGTKPPSFCSTAAPAAATASAWDTADVAGPDVISAAAAAMPELGAVRQYLAAARAAEVRLDQGAAEECVSRFRALQGGDAGLGWQDLNTYITLSKVLCASRGQTQFSMQAWDQVVHMERQRKARIAAMQQ